jgi:hypothetical protein
LYWVVASCACSWRILPELLLSLERLPREIEQRARLLDVGHRLLQR